MKRKGLILVLLVMAMLLPTVVCAEEGGSAHGDMPGRALVVYFSCTGNTHAVAEALASLTGSDIARIEPETAYTPEDLDYNNPNSRANLEIKDETARPAIAGDMGNFDQYDVIYVGYPIWWGDLPPILRTFFESADFSGKTVMPFCTSGSSGIEASVASIRAFIPDADVRDGLRATTGDREAQLTAWLEREGTRAASAQIVLYVGGRALTVALERNTSAEALLALLREAPRTIDMSDYGSFEKVGELGQSLPRNDERITAVPGDVILYQGNRLTIYYDTNTWEFTRLGRIQGVSAEDLKALLGDGDVTVTLSMKNEEE